jgi:hypothetical protein
MRELRDSQKASWMEGVDAEGDGRANGVWSPEDIGMLASAI